MPFMLTGRGGCRRSRPIFTGVARALLRRDRRQKW